MLDNTAIANAKVGVTIPVKMWISIMEALNDEFKGTEYFSIRNSILTRHFTALKSSAKAMIVIRSLAI
ncbi:hypothetical protein BG74_03545 [Sodalis-like endosymbiont of Proechinophthirus fluctus]|nr:hypothetical protein BG74_03545 [Sodalis-like endosymbiont of Proechinophthirus fluctus]